MGGGSEQEWGGGRSSLESPGVCASACLCVCAFVHDWGGGVSCISIMRLCVHVCASVRESMLTTQRKGVFVSLLFMCKEII